MNINNSQDNWLFHYTDAHGLQGILGDMAFWGTDANYLNDFKEIQLGISYAISWLKEHKKDIKNKFGSDVAGRIELNLNPKPGSQSGQRMFVCSFSTEKDSLSQWRSYGKGAGYAIGVHKSYLERKASELGLTLQECVYEHDELNNPVRYFLDKLLNSNYYNDFDDKKLLFICNGVMMNSIILKGSGFKEEKEWRIFPSNDFSIKYKGMQEFRIREGVFVPYIKFNLFPKNENEQLMEISINSSSPVLKLMIGPTPHKDLARNGISKMLWDLQSRYKFLSPEHSNISYRDW